MLTKSFRINRVIVSEAAEAKKKAEFEKAAAEKEAAQKGSSNRNGVNRNVPLYVFEINPDMLCYQT